MTARRFACFDIGTNTILLLIAEVRSGTIASLLERETIVGLGRGVDRTRQITGEAMGRGLACLQHDLELCKRHGCAEFLAVGTSVLRDASNAGAFIELVRAATGLDVKIISGEEEARLNFRGAISNKSDLPAPVAVFDLGGGSTEFVAGNASEIRRACSLDLGSVRLTERFLHGDPVTAAEVQALRDFVESQLVHNLHHDFGEAATWLGSGGTMTTLAAMAEQSAEYDAIRSDRYVLSKTRLETVLAALLQRTVEERHHLLGLAPARAEVIAGGALLCEAIMKRFRLDHVMISARDLRHGVVLAALAGEPVGAHASS